MHGVAFLLMAAALGHLLARRLRVPAIPVLLLTGVALARVTHPSAEQLEETLVLGVSFLLFLAGLELDPRRMRAEAWAALRIGPVRFLLLAGAGVVAATALGYTPLPSAYLALALTTSSTLVGVRLLRTRRRMYEPFGRLVLGVLLLQDLLVLASIPLFAGAGGGVAPVLTGLAGVAILAGLAALVRGTVAPSLLVLEGERELILLAPLAILFGFVGLGSGLGLPMVVGSFLAGMALSRFPVNGVVRIELAPLGDFFTALFFTALGTLVQLPTPSQLAHALVLGTVVVALTVPLVTLLAERAGFSAKPAIEAGLMLSQTSEISLVIGLAGLLQGHIDQDVFTVITLVTLGTMLLSPLLAAEGVARWLVRLHPSARGRPLDPLARGHVLLLGAGSTGMPLLENLLLMGAPTLVVDDDPAVLARLREAGVPTLRGDAADPGVLRRAGIDQARVVVSTVSRSADNQHVLEMSGGVPVLVRVFDSAEATWVRDRGGHPILYSEATADALLTWLDESGAELRERLHARGSAATMA